MSAESTFDKVNKHMFEAQSVPPTASTLAEQEPVAIAECHVVHGHMCQFLNRTAYGMQVLKDGDKLYTAPQPVQPAAHTRHAPLGFTSAEASAWSIGFEEGRAAGTGEE